ncbi:hypothetical protein OG989_04030 [Micromonospora sp. NBC_01740]|uniref:hypothetical protein n=1 Tax=Micromonospora sp. NBC_01740 TaxID=2975986 RepID=UPI002E13CFC5|nr:hypothetical protein OG989_04030 [Micromonospora sp. NBC_01740]
MAGLPQLREAAWLYGPGDPWAPLALVRLFEHRDGGGWEIRLNDPAAAETQTALHPDEASARAELARLYALGEADGRWRVRQPDGY